VASRASDCMEASFERASAESGFVSKAVRLPRSNESGTTFSGFTNLIRVNVVKELECVR
jgi:hypothetical protein